MCCFPKWGSMFVPPKNSDMFEGICFVGGPVRINDCVYPSESLQETETLCVGVYGGRF